MPYLALNIEKQDQGMGLKPGKGSEGSTATNNGKDCQDISFFGNTIKLAVARVYHENTNVIGIDIQM